MMATAKTFVAMSGGVDSSVAALLLKEEGRDVVGLHMSLWCEQKQGQGARRRQCCNADDARDAEQVCRHLGIPFYVVNFQEEFKAGVVDYFCREYARGRTPNPCLACNGLVKFGLLLKRVLALGGDHLATGHYARVAHDSEGCHRLLQGVDASKDQSYFLYMLGQQELAHLQFPVGCLTKADVRRLAHDAGLPVAGKADSVEVCFVADGDYRPFVASRLPLAAGEIVDLAGNVLGRHAGLAHYTVGQRHGVLPGGGRRLYVVRLDAADNRLVVGTGDALNCTALRATDVRWVAGQAPEAEVDCTARIRYRAPTAQAFVLSQGTRAAVRFTAPQRSVAPGQAVVFYRGSEVLGGGTIDAALGCGEEELAGMAKALS